MCVFVDFSATINNIFLACLLTSLLPLPVPGFLASGPACYRHFDDDLMCSDRLRTRPNVSEHSRTCTIGAHRYKYRAVGHNVFLTCAKHRWIIERDPDEPVTAQMFRALRGWLRLVLDGGWRGIREEKAPEPRPAQEVWALAGTQRPPTVRAAHTLATVQRHCGNAAAILHSCRGTTKLNHRRIAYDCNHWIILSYSILIFVFAFQWKTRDIHLLLH